MGEKDRKSTPLGTNMCPKKTILNVIFLFSSWDMLVRPMYTIKLGYRGPRFGVHSLGPVGGFLESQLFSTNPNFSESIFDLQRRPE